MAQDKQLARIEAKLDALLEEQGLDPQEFQQPQVGAVSRAQRERTPQEQQAIDNAPQVTPAVNAKANAPANAAPPAPAIPQDAVGKVTVETKQPSGESSTRTLSADQARAQQDDQARTQDDQARAAQQQAIDNAPDASAASGQQPTANSQQPMEPWQGYGDASADEVIERLRGMDAEPRDRALAYERANKNRVTITRVNWNS